MDWLQLLVNVFVTGILLYSIQKIFDERSAKRLEKFKAELQSTAFEKETKFTELHKMRAQAITELYEKLLDIRSKLDETIGLDQSLEAKHNLFQEITKSLEVFINIYIKDKLYLPEVLCEKIEEFHSKSYDLHTLTVIAALVKSEAVTEQFREEHLHDLAKAFDIVKIYISPLMVDIETEFRNLLGS